ncbi:MAG: esterase [Mesorhizobium sp.]|nr:esterase [Mesorhizobium sp. M2A.F.Ca.ET.017.03.2.1]RVD11605.1 esterase [Mesorhizobium sp. M2A.F.Ca.ET.029.05.1.1]RWF59946.1 MAG: esterase [Mesorhizobium sp.]TIW58951.1 MAG: esterase [Mesorhizobium sp.]TIW84282.1 MAG: esterase [Mesorhizobium sp.]
MSGFAAIILSRQADAASPQIVAIGADNVAGRGIGRRHPGGVGRSEAFPAQLQAMLRAKGVAATVTNAGRGGETTPGMLEHLNSDVPDGTRLVIIDIAKGNDKHQGVEGDEADALRQIKAGLTERHISFIVLPPWEQIPGATQNRDPDGHHFTAKGHAKIAAYLLPMVLRKLGGHTG